MLGRTGKGNNASRRCLPRTGLGQLVLEIRSDATKSLPGRLLTIPCTVKLLICSAVVTLFAGLPKRCPAWERRWVWTGQLSRWPHLVSDEDSPQTRHASDIRLWQ